ncbi:MAG TPA: NAD(P)-dependent oxidoreductase [Planctomycetes bacterium]|nr:NAD(P)-dependent oxidoreductase [Planctomycetota bacterium]
MSFSFQGRTVVITGASSGIGAACARLFAEGGARLWLAARRESLLKGLAEELMEQGMEAPSVQALDVRDFDAVEDFSRVVGVPDILVNNAGLSRGLGPLYEGKRVDWDEMIDTNVKGLLAVNRAFLPGMVAGGAGHLIHIGSIAGREVYPGGNVYCATKHAVDALTKSLRLDLSGTGVKVSTVDPGLVETEFGIVRYRGNAEKASAVYEGMLPLVAEDVAQAVGWAASRPQHVNAAEILLLPADQASSSVVHRD